MIEELEDGLENHMQIKRNKFGLNWKKNYNILEKPALAGFEKRLQQVLAIRAQNRVFPLETHPILWKTYKLRVE